MTFPFTKRTLFLISSVMLSAIGLVVVLAWSALKPINENKGFNRNVIVKNIDQLQAFEKPKDVVEFAGSSLSQLYFKTTNPAKIFVTDYSLQNEYYVSTKIPQNPKIYSRFNTIVDSPNIYILAGSLPGILKTKIDDTSTTYNFPGAIFTRSALISENSFVIRVFDHLNQVFMKGNPVTGKVIKESNISEKKNDAGISTDGSLMYDKKTNTLVYIQHYKNEILCLDTNLNLIKKIKTIDVNSSSLETAEKVSSKGIITSLKPKRLLNAFSCTNNGYLYNDARIIADNEDASVLKENSIIDVYDIKSGLAIGSFYIPDYKSEKIKGFKVLYDRLVCLYNSNMVVYKLPFIPKN